MGIFKNKPQATPATEHTSHTGRLSRAERDAFKTTKPLNTGKGPNTAMSSNYDQPGWENDD